MRHVGIKDVPLIVVDAPLLIEAGMIGMVDEVWVVAIPEELQLQRLRERDNLSVTEAQEIGLANAFTREIKVCP